MAEAVIVDAVRLAPERASPVAPCPEPTRWNCSRTCCARSSTANGLDPVRVDDVIGGCVQQVGEQASNISRTALLSAGFPESVPATTIDRQCGSSQQAAHFAAQGVIAGAYDIVIACGVESMSRIPMGTSPIGQDASGRASPPATPKAWYTKASRQN